MESTSLVELVETELATARGAASGRAASTVYGGHDHELRQTLIALVAGQELSEHESPGEATLQVLRGVVVLSAGEDERTLQAGELAPIPPRRHALRAVEDSAVLLTVVKSPR